jgi:Xaa-Pro aminopeptidase
MTLFVADIEGVPSITDWLGSVLSRGDKVGIDPTLFGISHFQNYAERLQKFGITLVPMERNLIDVIWTTSKGRPKKMDTTLLVLKMEFAGKFPL